MSATASLGQRPTPPGSRPTAARTEPATVLAASIPGPVALAAAAVESRRERLITDEDCMRIARHRPAAPATAAGPEVPTPSPAAQPTHACRPKRRRS